MIGDFTFTWTLSLNCKYVNERGHVKGRSLIRPGSMPTKVLDISFVVIKPFLKVSSQDSLYLSIPSQATRLFWPLSVYLLIRFPWGTLIT